MDPSHGYNNRHGSDYGAPPPSNYCGDDTYSGAPTSHTHHAGSYQADAYAATGHGHHSNAVGYSHGGVGYGGGREGGGYGGGGGDGGYGGGSGSGTVRILCKADPNFSLAVKYNNTLVLTPTDAREVEQRWYKDERFSRNRKDEEGFPCFSLINKATNLAMKHAKGDKQHVQLVPYNPNTYDESILWSMSKDFGDGYRAMRMVNNIRLNVDALKSERRQTIRWCS